MYHMKWVFATVDRKYRKWLALGLFLSALTSSTHMINCILRSRVIDDVIYAQNKEPLAGIIITMIAVTLTWFCSRYVMAMALEYASQSSLIHLRAYLYEKIQNMDVTFYDKHRAGDIMTRLSPDLDLCRHFIAYLTYATIDCVTEFLASIILFFTISWKLTLCLIAVLPGLLIVTQLYSKKVGPMFTEARDRFAEMNTAAQENIMGNRVVRAFAREEYEKERFEVRNLEFRGINLKINKTWLCFYPVIESFASMLRIVTIFAGSAFVISGDLTIGQLTIFTGLSWTLEAPMRSLGALINDLQRFNTSAQKIMEVYYATSNITDKPDAQHREHMQGAIDFRHVDFAYDEKPVLRDINIHVDPGKTLAIMGPTGCGKTTLVQMLARFYDVKSGSVSVDGCDVRDWKLNELRKGIGMATQDVFLFSDTVEGNIAFGDPDLSEEDAKDYARRAGAAQFIEKLPEGYDTIIGERGVGLSGGQKQRIALARALAVKPSILVLDDTTSALDMETEQFIQQQLRELPFECTKIIIGQRISSVRHADEIIILKDGSISERGTHDELLAQRGYYYETYCLQQGISETEGGVA